MVNIRRNLVNQLMFPIKCPHEIIPKFIVVHNTANDASARNEISYMIRNKKKVSFHYAVDDKEIIQGIPVNRNAWHAGDDVKPNGGNMCGIAIEICYSLSGGERFDKAEQNAAEFIASLLIARGWDISHVKKHQDFSGKYCPHRTLNKGWNRFLKMIEFYMAGSYLVRITAEELNVRKGPGIKYEIVTTVKKKEVYTIVDESNGWGKLKSGVGWISLKYTEKVV